MVQHAEADFVIGHVTEATIEEIVPLTDGKGPHVIIEFLTNKNLKTDLKLIAPFGILVIVGNRGSIEINPRLAMAKEKECEYFSDRFLECTQG